MPRQRGRDAREGQRGEVGIIPTPKQIAAAQALVDELEKKYRQNVSTVTKGAFVRGVMEGTFPLEVMDFWVVSHFHLINNDIKNLAHYVTKSRDEEEVGFYLLMTIAETRMLESLYLLWDGLGHKREELHASEPDTSVLARTDYFSVLAMYATPGEIALAIILNFPLWANGARRLSKGLKKHYGMGKKAPGSRKKDTDLLDRFSHATAGFRQLAVRLIAKDLSPESETRMRRVGRLSVETEAIVWDRYSEHALEIAGRVGKKGARA